MMTPGILPPESSSFIFTTIPGFSPHQSYGGFGLNGSAGSYLKVLRAILNGGTLDGATILKPETVRSMFQPHFPSQSHKGDLVAFLKGELPQVDHTRIVGEDLNWGYGGMLNEKELPSGRGKYSLTWSGLMNTFWVIDPTNDIGFCESPTLTLFHHTSSSSLMCRLLFSAVDEYPPMELATAYGDVGEARTRTV